MDRYRILVTTIGAVVGVIMVLIFSFVAAESLLMRFLPGVEPAQGAVGGSGGGAVSLHESNSVSGPNMRQNATETRFYTAGIEVSQTGEPQTSAPQDQQGLLTAIVGSDLVVQTTGAVEQIVETLVPIQVDLGADRLLERLQGHLPIKNEAARSLLSPVF